jgi:anionic cell wall polymer biosynthesis LytR-Cps2A-Psr (LCP) family protein
MYVSDNKQSNIVYLIDKEAGSSKSTTGGRRINIAVTGLDGRIGRLSKLADANHVISILIETGQIEIISVPRDTYVDLGYDEDDTLNLNKLTICRAKKGRKEYLVALAEITKVNKIHY